MTTSQQQQSVRQHQQRLPAETIRRAMMTIPPPSGQRNSSSSNTMQRSYAVEKLTSRGKLVSRVMTISSDNMAIFCTKKTINDDDDSDDDEGVTKSSSRLANKLPVPFLSRKGLRGITAAYRSKYIRYLDVADLSYVYAGVMCTQQQETSKCITAETSSRNMAISNISNTTSRVKKRANSGSSSSTSNETLVTIGYKGEQSTMNLLLPDEAQRNEFVAVVRHMMATYDAARRSVHPEVLLLRYIWYDIDTNHDAYISEREFGHILQRVNCGTSSSKLYRKYCKTHHIKSSKKLLKDASSNGMDVIHVMNLLQIIKNKTTSAISTKKDYSTTLLSMSNRIWDSTFGSTTDTVSVDTFYTKFTTAVQKDTAATKHDIQTLFVKLNTQMELGSTEYDDDITENGTISRARFDLYLYHTMNDVFYDAQQQQVLNKPMSFYYINTSHNTYLTGDQVRSFSSVEMYAKILRRGCKCLELDCWDGVETKKKGNQQQQQFHPVVFHGYTLTSKILFSDICDVVHNYMKENSTSYPIILSLENHCSHDYQRAIANILHTTFGTMLYVPGKHGTNDNLPSPESLRGKIVIKGKRPPEKSETTTVTTPTASPGSGKANSTPSKAAVAAAVVMATTNVAGKSKDDDDDDDDPYEEDANDTTSDPKDKKASFFAKMKNQTAAADTNSSGDPHLKPTKPPKIVKELASITLFHGTHWKDFTTSTNAPQSHMHSISEPKIPKVLAKSSSREWRKYNCHHMTRTYPSGARVDSSNYNPLQAWAVGSQLVALNFQTSDSPLIINDGMFRQNGGCGYVQKPPVAMNDDIPFPNKPIQLCNIRILSGSCLPKPLGAKSGETIDPYVQVVLHDVMADGAENPTLVASKHSTGTVSDNGFCPIWNENKPKKMAVYSPDLAILEFTLREADIGLDDYVAYAAIPVSCMRNGYRSVQLYDKDYTRTGPYSCASLLVHMDIIDV